MKNPSSQSDPLLLGSTFPLALIRRRAIIAPASIEELKREMAHRLLVSFWGHRNTLAAARAILGVDVAPRTERPALILNDDNLPTLEGRVFRECWVLSPDYATGYRPALGEEVPADNIIGWQVLRIKWL